MKKDAANATPVGIQNVENYPQRRLSPAGKADFRLAKVIRRPKQAKSPSAILRRKKRATL